MQLMPKSVSLPPTEFRDSNGPVSISSFSGQFVLLNFWATWCAPCVKEMPSLDRLASRLEANGVRVVALSQDEAGPTQVDPFVEGLNLSNITILYDPANKAFRNYALRGLPTTFLISPEGKLIGRLEGAAQWDEGFLAEQVEKLTANPN